jgi:hypothetical protein
MVNMGKLCLAWWFKKVEGEVGSVGFGIVVLGTPAYKKEVEAAGRTAMKDDGGLWASRR